MTHGPLSWRELVERDKQKSKDAHNQIKRAAMQPTPRPQEAVMTDIVQRLLEWGDLPSSVEFLDSVEAIFDPGNRHKSGAKPTDYLASWISMLRPYAYATSDDSWGELEKLLCIVMRNYVMVRRDAGAAAAEIERNRATIAALEASLREADENINLKADFIDATINQCAAKDQEIDELKEALHAAEEREKALHSDAERYHWLRDHSCPPHNFYISVPDEFAGQRYAPGDVDAYIDAARQALAGAKPC